jgi:hypothetical protein
MARTFPPALAISHGLLRVLVVLNILAGLLVLGLLVTSFVARDFFVEALTHPPKGAVAPSIGAMRLIMLVGLASFPLAHILFSRLLAIVGTVWSGNAFAMANAGRLRACAWAVLGLEGMHLVIGIVAATLPFNFNWEFSPIGLLAVLLLFVLAQVFTEGARMRDELEGTV